MWQCPSVFCVYLLFEYNGLLQWPQVFVYLYLARALYMYLSQHETDDTTEEMTIL